MNNKLVILDRDGTINQDSDDYIKSPEEWIPLPGALEAIARINHAGWHVVVASNQRLVLQRQFEQAATLSPHHLIAELYTGVDWVLVEGFKDSDLLKIEVWRPCTGKAVRYPHDDFIVAIATDEAQSLPVPTNLDVLDLNDPEQVADWLLQSQDRFVYQFPLVNP